MIFIRNIYISLLFFMLVSIGYVRNMEAEITWIFCFVVAAYVMLTIDDSNTIFKELMLRKK